MDFLFIEVQNFSQRFSSFAVSYLVMVVLPTNTNIIIFLICGFITSFTRKQDPTNITLSFYESVSIIGWEIYGEED